MIVKTQFFLAAVLAAASIATPLANAQPDKQGKTSLETHRSRPKENQRTKSGTQRAQERTKDRTAQILDQKKSDQVRNNTSQRVTQTLNKKR